MHSMWLGLRRDLVGFCALVALACAACASEQEVLVSDPAATATSAASDAAVVVVQPFVGIDGGLTVAPPMDAGARADAGSLDASTGDAAPTRSAVEVCDGADNDGNGTIDDVDLMRDGICDCLKIATLGIPGGSGEGDIFGSWLDSRSDSPATPLRDAQLTPELLRQYQIIVVEDLHTLKRTYSDAELDSLAAWVRNGGGLMTLIGYAKPDERTNVNELLRRFGVSYGEQPILARTGTTTVAVSTWLGPHPVVEGVKRVGVDNGYPVLGEGTTLAREGGFDLLKVQEVGNGHLIVWGDEWITYDSEWSRQSDYQVERLWVNMIKWLTVARVCQVPDVLI
jgi:hypothetical protein